MICLPNLGVKGGRIVVKRSEPIGVNVVTVQATESLFVCPYVSLSVLRASVATIRLIDNGRRLVVVRESHAYQSPRVYTPPPQHPPFFSFLSALLAYARISIRVFERAGDNQPFKFGDS